jgi:hypothetical protein
MGSYVMSKTEEGLCELPPGISEEVVRYANDVLELLRIAVPREMTFTVLGHAVAMHIALGSKDEAEMREALDMFMDYLPTTTCNAMIGVTVKRRAMELGLGDDADYETVIAAMKARQP